MGGHSAWRKRQKNGETAKGNGGSIMRHRPHLNRGKPIYKKGELRGGNPKKGGRGKRDKEGGGEGGEGGEARKEGKGGGTMWKEFLESQMGLKPFIGR